MVTATRATHHSSTLVVRGPESSPAAEIISADVDGFDFDDDLDHLFQAPAAGQVLQGRRTFLSALIQGLKDFRDNFVGRPMSRQERAKLAIAEAGDPRFLTMSHSRLV